jgi:hypothetical protein
MDAAISGEFSNESTDCPMKIITNNTATVSRRTLPDDTLPRMRVPQQVISAAVKSRYQFPDIPPLVSMLTPPNHVVMQGGQFTYDNSVHDVAQLVMETIGDSVTTTSTDVGNAFLDDLFSFLDSEFGFRLTSAPYKTSYASVLIVEFDVKLEEKILLLGRIATLLSEMWGDAEKPFNLQRLAFGRQREGAPTSVIAAALIPQSQVAVVEATDFTIERRAGTPFSANRYFCAAPFTTEDHIKSLERIEKLLS